MIEKEILKACYHLHNPQNALDQIKKRSDRWFCPIYVRYVNIKWCSEEKCPYYYSVEGRMIDNL